MAELPDVVISVGSGLEPGMADDLLGAVRQRGLTTAVEERGPEVYAGVEWLLATPVVLWLADKYFGGMLEEAGKSHYDSLRSAWRRLLQRTTGPHREIRVMAVVSRSSPEKVKDPELPVLSVYCPLHTGQRVKFVFEHSLAEGAHELAVDLMHDLMARHYSSPDGGDLVAELTIQGVARERTVVLRFDTVQRRWRAWNPRGLRG